MIAIADLAAFLVGRGVVEAPIIGGPFVPTDTPDRVVIVTLTGGPGRLVDGLFDVHTFQALMRGAQRVPNDAETIAKNVDDSILRDIYPPGTIGGRTVTRLDRSGGPPVAFARDTAGRSQFVCNYLVAVARL